VYGNLLWNQFLVRSDAAVAQGLTGLFPRWYAPLDPSAYDHRTFFHAAWLPALGLFAFRQLFGRIDNTVLGYGLFRLTSDVEKLPFPLAPIGAQGVMALADDLDGQETTAGAWRWRVFSIGSAIGIGFGALYMALPTITGALFPGSTWAIFPIPFVDWTDYTKSYLPAVATGLTFDLGLIILGMVLPYYAMVGSFIGLVVTVVLNPLLYKWGVLYSWTPGDLTVDTMFKNYLDLYFSFGIGLSLAVAVMGVWSIVRMRRTSADRSAERASGAALAAAGHGGSSGPDTAGSVPAGRDMAGSVPAGRGDIPPRLIVVCYIATTSIYILVCGYLIDWHPGVMAVLVGLGFFYTPVISYVTARLEGLAGQVVEIPFVRELAFILSGYRGIAVWFLPIPMSNYGVQTVFYRQAELTGTKFRSLWKAEVFLFPIIVIATVVFSSFIWGLADVPSAAYPYAQKLWELSAKNQLLVYASTTGEYSQFQEALSGSKVAIGFGVGMLAFALLSLASAPVTLLYGLVRGIGQTYPHSILPQFVGALLGRFYFEKKLGLRWREYVPVLFAGYACGVGLITMLCIGLVFLFKATSALPY
jgi:hypothetical protein